MIVRDFTNGKKQELIEQIKEVGEDRPWEQTSPLSFPVPDEIFQPFRAGAVFYNSLVDKNIQTVGEIEKIWTEVQRLDDAYGSRLKNIQAMADNLNAKIALIDRAIGTNLASALSQAPSTFLAGIDEINEKIFNNKVDIEYSKLVSCDEKGNLVYDYEAIVLALIHSKSDFHTAALERLIQTMEDENGNINKNIYHDFMINLYLKIISSKEFFDTIYSQVPLAGFSKDSESGQWHTNEFNIQRLFGFADAYNAISALLGCQIDDEKVVFEMPLYDENGQPLKDLFGNTLKMECRWEWWVGTYGARSYIGGEAGIYSRIVAYNEDDKACDFPLVAPYSDNIIQPILNFQSMAVNEMPTVIRVYDKNNYGLPLIEQDTRDYALFGDHYWNLVTKKNEDKKYIQGDLALEVEYEIKDDITRTAFLDAAQGNSNIQVRHENGSDFVTIYWSPEEMEEEEK